jgi:hypothetical protein
MISPAKSTPDDKRAIVAAIADEDETALRESARAALDEAQCQYNEDALDLVVSDLQGITRATEVAKLRLLEVGRRLLKLQEHVGPGGYRALYRRGLVSVEASTAAKLRQIARAVDGGRIPEDRLPTSVKPAYIAATLPVETITRLLSAGTIHPAATTRQIREAAVVGSDSPPPAPPGELTARQQRLLRLRLENYERKAAELRFRLGLISANQKT